MPAKDEKQIEDECNASKTHEGQERGNHQISKDVKWTKSKEKHKNEKGNSKGKPPLDLGRNKNRARPLKKLSHWNKCLKKMMNNAISMACANRQLADNLNLLSYIPLNLCGRKGFFDEIAMS
ncbi:MAG: hypothetical protein ACI837_000830 [Crocinitomicaceae bacterium]|jgi:hypothetical protein